MNHRYKRSGFAAAALIACMAFAATAPALAQTATHSAKEIKEDIARHRAMSTAHENAAKCLEAGKTGGVCEKELQTACKGLAIGKYCGMKHVH